MPLAQSASRKAVGENIRREEAAGKPYRQSLAIALDTQRKNRADGGGTPSREPIHLGGLVAGHDGGRADTIECSVPRGSYIIPADIVSGIGQGNTTRGAKVLDRVFDTAALVANPASQRMPMIPVKLSSGEYSIHPAAVTKWGNGNLKRGHDTLDKLVVDTRAKLANEMKNLPGPKGPNEK